MTLYLALFGAFIGLLGLLGVVRPATLLLLVFSAWRSKWGLYYAVTFRLTFGIVALLAAPECSYPQTIRVLGFLSLASALAIPLMGHARVTKFIGWWMARPPTFTRLWALAAAAFGAFLVHASV